LNSNDTVTDQLIVNTIDGTSHTITIYIKGEDEPVTTETAASTSTGSTDTSSSDTSSTNTGTTDTTTTVSNSPAIISGTDTGKVTEDWDDNNDGLLGWTGKLDITDSDAGEASFVATTVYSDYGSIQIDSSGNWFYGAINTLESIQSLNSGETLTDILTVASIDGTTHDVTITINGVDEPVAADTTSSDSTSTNTTTDTAATAVDINLSWTAPAEREDNTALSLSEIAGYKIYYGTTQGNYTNSVDVNDSTTTSYTFKSLVAGTYYFVITTRDVDGRESQYSTEIITTI
jgi:VCBS repeat-containing protein